ncbi:MAG: hypothetical protein L0Y66_24720 [Myxococcaceae bacterium]|nr:hypothetical protein [Myxococcaceae bacterium]MCI0670588.1 hypothetical protein [Myxococcaceae bacterium]
MPVRRTHVTIDHDEIFHWADVRGGRPAKVKGTGRGEDHAGILRIDFPGFSGGSRLEHIEWDEFLEAFEDHQLAFLFQDLTPTGQLSRFNKLVSRASVDLKTGAHTHAPARRPRKVAARPTRRVKTVQRASAAARTARKRRRRA